MVFANILHKSGRIIANYYKCRMLYVILKIRSELHHFQKLTALNIRITHLIVLLYIRGIKRNSADFKD